MTETLDTIILVLAAFCMLIALLLGLRTLWFRSRSSKASYGVAQQESRRAMLKEGVRGAVIALVGLILFGLVGLSPRPPADPVPSTAAAPAPSPTLASPGDVAPSATSSPTKMATLSPTETPIQPATLEATATLPAATPTPTVTETSSPTSTPQPATAVVNSEVGVWLRDVPGVESEQLEWLLEGTVLTLLPGQETADELEWQHVISPDGTEGWVAVLYIIYQE